MKNPCISKKFIIFSVDKILNIQGKKAKKNPGKAGINKILSFPFLNVQDKKNWYKQVPFQIKNKLKPFPDSVRNVPSCACTCIHGSMCAYLCAYVCIYECP